VDSRIDLKTRKKWISRFELTSSTRKTIQSLSLVDQFLSSRKINAAEATKKPSLKEMKSPWELHGVERAAQRIFQAIQGNEHILFYGDYDVDGLSSLALLDRFMKDISYTNYECYFPDRYKEGYGVHTSVLDRKHQANEKLSLVVTFDTGITAFEPASFLKSKNIDFIITDHHLCQEKLPEAVIIVNPQQKDDHSEFQYLCGAGVAFYLLIGLRAELKKNSYTEELPQLETYLDLFALATISDQVPMIGENHLLCKVGLKMLSETKSIGLKFLMELLGLAQKSITSEDIAFSIAPKINAAGRLGKTMDAYSLLTTNDYEEASRLSSLLVSYNEQRVLQQEAALTAIEIDLNKRQLDFTKLKILCICGEWNEGISGILASRLVETYSIPVLVGAFDGERIKASMRAYADESCVGLLAGVGEGVIEKFGGHAKAAGLSLPKANFETLWKELQEQILKVEKEDLYKSYFYDGLVPDSVEMSDLQALNSFAPWGPQNRKANYLFERIPLNSAMPLKEKHFKLKHEGYELIAFNKWQELEKLKENNQFFDALVEFSINEFRGNKRIQLQVIDFQAHEPDEFYHQYVF